MPALLPKELRDRVARLIADGRSEGEASSLLRQWVVTNSLKRHREQIIVGADDNIPVSSEKRHRNVVVAMDFEITACLSDYADKTPLGQARNF